MEKALKLGIIGLGNMGSNHARISHALSDFELKAVVDTDPDQRAKASANYGCHAYEKVATLLKEENLDAVVIAAPTRFHYDLVKQTLESGLHVLVEKPITSNVEAADELILIAKKQKKVLTVGHIERFNPAVLALKAVLETGKLGTPVSALARRLSPAPSQIKDMNVVVDLAVHDIDVISFLFGEQPTQTWGASKSAILRDRPDQAQILLEYPHATAVVEVNWVTPLKIRTLMVTGTKGYAELAYADQSVTIYVPDANESGGYKKEALAIEKKDQLQEELKEFAAAIRENRKPLVSPESARESLRLALRILTA